MEAAVTTAHCLRVHAGPIVFHGSSEKMVSFRYHILPFVFILSPYINPIDKAKACGFVSAKHTLSQKLKREHNLRLLTNVYFEHYSLTCMDVNLRKPAKYFLVLNYSFLSLVAKFSKSTLFQDSSFAVPGYLRRPWSIFFTRLSYANNLLLS